MGDTKVRVARILAELVVIVVGVLIAFQVDQWNEGRLDRNRERDQLLALRVDFEANRTRLDNSIRQQHRTLAAIGTLIRIFEETDARPPNDSLAALVVQANIFSRFEQVSGAYDALVNSGDIGLLSSAELRAELAGFSAAAGTGYEDVRMADDIHVDLMRLMPQLFSFWHVLPSSYADLLGVTASTSSLDFDPLFESDQFFGLITAAGILEVNHLRYFEGLRRRAADVEALLDQELGY